MSGDPKHSQITALVKTAVRNAQREPARRSEILGKAAITFAGLAEDRRHIPEAPVLRQLAATFAEAAMQPATTDDFHEQLEEYHAAYEQQGSASDLHNEARAEAVHDVSSEAARGAQRVSIAPVTWGKGATLGRQGTFKWAPTDQEIKDGVQQSGTLVMWQGEPHEACAITVDVGQVFPATADGDDEHPANLRPYGRVAYGSDGTIGEVDFDIGCGTRFTVVGNYVSVVVGMIKPTAASRNNPSMTVGASIGAFAAPSTAPVTLTKYIDRVLENNISDYIPRPAKAVSMLPPMCNQSAGTTVVGLYGIGGGAAPLYKLTYQNGIPSSANVPLAGDVGLITVSNFSGLPARYRLIFQLAL